MSEKRLFTTKEAMEYLGIKSEDTIYSLIKQGKLINVSIDRFKRFDKQDLDKLIESQKETRITELEAS